MDVGRFAYFPERILIHPGARTDIEPDNDHSDARTTFTDVDMLLTLDGAVTPTRQTIH